MKSIVTELSSDSFGNTLTHPEKIIFPEDGISKFDLLNYYVHVAPRLLNHIKGRALTIKRFPQGISKPGFFQKNKPENTPEWIPSIRTGIVKSDFLIINNLKSLKWLINQNTIELHQSAGRIPKINFADYIVFDLDPPANSPFGLVSEVACKLKPVIESSGFTPFVKTSGGKGLHILLPIKPNKTPAEIVQLTRSMVRSFPQPGLITCEQRINKRRNKVYVDLSRNYSGQTIVAPYSLRARPAAPVSTPLFWKELNKIKNPAEFNLNAVSKRIADTEDPWKNFSGFAINAERLKKQEL